MQRIDNVQKKTIVINDKHFDRVTFNKKIDEISGELSKDVFFVSSQTEMTVNFINCTFDVDTFKVDASTTDESIIDQFNKLFRFNILKFDTCALTLQQVDDLGRACLLADQTVTIMIYDDKRRDEQAFLTCGRMARFLIWMQQCIDYWWINPPEDADEASENLMARYQKIIKTYVMVQWELTIQAELDYQKLLAYQCTSDQAWNKYEKSLKKYLAEIDEFEKLAKRTKSNTLVTNMMLAIAELRQDARMFTPLISKSFNNVNNQGKNAAYYSWLAQYRSSRSQGQTVYSLAADDDVKKAVLDDLIKVHSAANLRMITDLSRLSSVQTLYSAHTSFIFSLVHAMARKGQQFDFKRQAGFNDIKYLRKYFEIATSDKVKLDIDIYINDICSGLFAYFMDLIERDDIVDKEKETKIRQIFATVKRAIASRPDTITAIYLFNTMVGEVISRYESRYIDERTAVKSRPKFAIPLYSEMKTLIVDIYAKISVCFKVHPVESNYAWQRYHASNLANILMLRFAVRIEFNSNDLKSYGKRCIGRVMRILPDPKQFVTDVFYRKTNGTAADPTTVQLNSVLSLESQKRLFCSALTQIILALDEFAVDMQNAVDEDIPMLEKRKSLVNMLNTCEYIIDFLAGAIVETGLCFEAGVKMMVTIGYLIRVPALVKGYTDLKEAITQNINQLTVSEQSAMANVSAQAEKGARPAQSRKKHVQSTNGQSDNKATDSKQDSAVAATSAETTSTSVISSQATPVMAEATPKKKAHLFINRVDKLIAEKKYQQAIDIVNEFLKRFSADNHAADDLSEYPYVAALYYRLYECHKLLNKALPASEQNFNHILLTAEPYLTLSLEHNLTVQRSQLHRFLLFMYDLLKELPEYLEMQTVQQQAAQQAESAVAKPQDKEVGDKDRTELDTDLLGKKITELDRPVFDLIETMESSLPESKIGVYGSTVTSALLEKLHPFSVKAFVSDTDIVVVVRDANQAADELATKLKFKKNDEMRKENDKMPIVLHGTIANRQVDVAIVDHVTTLQEFSDTLDLTSKSGIVSKNGVLVAISNRAIDDIKARRVKLMPVGNKPIDPRRLLNWLRTAVTFDFTHAEEDKQIVIDNVHRIATLNGKVIRTHLMKHFHSGRSLKMLTHWREFGLFTILFGREIAAVANQQAFDQMCTKLDESFARYRNYNLQTIYSLIASVIVASRAVLTLEQRQEPLWIRDSDMQVLSGLSLTERESIICLVNWYENRNNEVKTSSAKSITSARTCRAALYQQPRLPEIDFLQQPAAMSTESGIAAKN